MKFLNSIYLNTHLAALGHWINSRASAPAYRRAMETGDGVTKPLTDTELSNMMHDMRLCDSIVLLNKDEAMRLLHNPDLISSAGVWQEMPTKFDDLPSLFWARVNIDFEGVRLSEPAVGLFRPERGIFKLLQVESQGRRSSGQPGRIDVGADFSLHEFTQWAPLSGPPTQPKRPISVMVERTLVQRIPMTINASTTDEAIRMAKGYAMDGSSERTWENVNETVTAAPVTEDKE